MKRAIAAILKVICLMALCRVCRVIFINVYALTLVLLGNLGVIASAADTYWQHSFYVSMWSEVLLIPLLWLFYRFRGRDACERLFLTPCRVRPMVLSIVIGLSACMVVSFLLTVLPFPVVWQQDYAEKSDQLLNERVWWQTAIMTIVVAPIVEEFVFRGLIYKRLRGGMPPVIAAAIASVIFGIAHGSPIWFVYTFLLGMVHAWLLERTNSLLPPILCHMAFNILGQISVFPIGTPYIVVYAVYILCIALFVLAMHRFAAVTRKPPVLTEVSAVFSETT